MIALSFYRFLTTTTRPLLKVIALVSPNSKIGRTILLREQSEKSSVWAKGFQKASYGFENAIWVHAASGEFEYAKPVIRKIKTQWPEQKVIVSFYSPSYQKQVENFAGVDDSFALPFDDHETMMDLIDFLKPKALLFARTDVWTELALAAKSKKIPALLFSASLTEESGRNSKLIRSLTALSFNSLNQIHCVSESDREVFLKIGTQIDKIKATGDTRFEQVIERLESPKELSKAFHTLERGKTFVFGSLWPEDFYALKELIKAQKDMTLILVPHETDMEHINWFKTQLKDLTGTEPILYSELSAATSIAGKTCLVDKVGILAELYQRGSFAFVGGSFRKTVHSVMEPLAAGCITFVGPKYLNNREAIEFSNLQSPIETLNYVTVTLGQTDFVERLIKVRLAIQKQINLSKNFSDALISEVKKRQGATQSVIAWLQDYV